MAWFPISHTVPQYENSSGVPYSGAVLKAYASGTSTPINMAIDSAGVTEVGSLVLNSSGYPAQSGNTVIPYVEQKYKLSLYPTQAAADANSGAIWTVDAIPIAGDFGAVTQTITTTTVLDSSDIFNHIEASGTITITLPDIDTVGSGFVATIRNSGSGIVTLDGDGSETVNGDLSIYLYPGDFALVQSGSTNWTAGISRKKRISIYAGFHATREADELPLNGSSIALTSGGTYNGAQFANVYAYLWNNLADTEAAVAGGRGASAVADFAANKTITLPDYRDYALIGVSGAGSITTVGAKAGASTVVSSGTISNTGATTLDSNSIPSHTHPYTRSGGASLNGSNVFPIFDGSSGNVNANTTGSTGGGGSHTHTGGTYTGDATSVLQKSAGVYWYINF